MAQNSKIEWTDHPATIRFKTKVAILNAKECWQWKGAKMVSGYGVFFLNAFGIRNTTAHRASFILANGIIPVGLHIDHLCRNRACVNPAHLEAISNQENAQRGALGRLVTRCVHGHEYTPENTGRAANGRRQCKTCRRAQNRGRRNAAYWREYRTKRKQKNGITN